MKHILAIAVTMGLMTAAELVHSEPLTFGRYGSSPRGRMYEAMECAVKRWRAATCLPIDLSVYPQHGVTWASPSAFDGTWTAETWGPYDTAKIRVFEFLDDLALCQALVHEFGHVLRRSYGHPGPDNSMSYTETHNHHSVIMTEDLEFVCAVRPCTCMVPEPSVTP